jgi:hypothetical protein
MVCLNPKLLQGYISWHFSEMPQLLGGNHTTTACYAVLRSHFHENEVSGEKFFKAPGNSKITEDLIWKFKSRQGKVLISSLPFDQAIKSARLCQGLLSSARTLNDHTKEVKNRCYTTSW